MFVVGLLSTFASKQCFFRVVLKNWVVIFIPYRVCIFDNSPRYAPLFTNKNTHMIGYKSTYQND